MAGGSTPLELGLSPAVDVAVGRLPGPEGIRPMQLRVTRAVRAGEAATSPLAGTPA